MPSRTGPPTGSGRWSLLPPREPEPARRLHALALALLDRHGIVTRGAVTAERVPGGFGALYPVLRAMEEAGQCRRGYFVEGLGAAQFALPGAVDRMRGLAAARALPEADSAPGAAVVLSAADPASPYGAALPWPARPDEAASTHRPGRKAGALVVLLDGKLILYVERGGKTLLSWTSDTGELALAAAGLTATLRGSGLPGQLAQGRRAALTVERADGTDVAGTPLAQALAEAGFRPTPRGMRLRG